MQDFGTEEDDDRKMIVLTARIHSGDTGSSFTIQGIIDFLLSNDEEAVTLRENFIFKIIPMLNPDGVVNGNSKCSLTGIDLSKQWGKPVRLMHPTIYAAKNLLQEYRKKIALYGGFYGEYKQESHHLSCCYKEPKPENMREFPFLLSQVSDPFTFSHCK